MKKIEIFTLFICLFTSACTQPISIQQLENKKEFLAKSTSKLPALLYGLGDDRLGGAKMGYIDTNILLKIIDTSIAPWKVQLSKYRTAFIDKVYVKKDTTLHQKPFYLTSNFKVFGTDSCYDIVTINMDEKLPYKSWMQTEPAAIQLEIFGVQSLPAKPLVAKSKLGSWWKIIIFFNFKWSKKTWKYQ